MNALPDGELGDLKDRGDIKEKDKKDMVEGIVELSGGYIIL